MRRIRILGLAAALALLTGVSSMAVTITGPVTAAYAVGGGGTEPPESPSNPAQTDPGDTQATPPESMPAPGEPTLTPFDEILSSGSSVGPSYYLYLRGTGATGPCSPTLGTYDGIWTLPLYHYYVASLHYPRVYVYQTVYKNTINMSNFKYTYYVELAFNTAYRYKGCSVAPVYRYYGANKVSRTKKWIQPCWSSGCGPGSWSYEPWHTGWY